jgi:type IV pilus assembly protein PilO
MAVSLTQLPWYGQIGAFVLVCALAVFGFWNFYVKDVQAELATKQARLAQLRRDINRGLATARRLSEFQAQVSELEARLDALKAVLPDQKDYGDLLRRIQMLATQSNLTILQFVPQPSVTKQIHAEWPSKLVLDGSYHNLARFFDRVSKFPRLITISDVTIKAKPQQQPESTIVAECTATTYVLLENPAPTAGAAAPKPGAPRPGAPPAPARR